MSIAKYAAIDALRKKKVVPFSAFDTPEGDNVLLDTHADAAPLPSELFDRAHLDEELVAAMETLPSAYRAALVLHYKDGFTFQEIADSLGESVNTVKSRYRRALIALKDQLLSAPK